jgi:hypothetical protein
VEQTARTNLRAFGLSALVHAVALLVTWNLDLSPRAASADAATAPAVETVELNLVPAEPEPAPAAATAVAAPAATAPQPRGYLDVPERLASAEPPPRADYLAIVNSRAADEVAGGTPEATPSAPLPGEAPQVAIKRDDPEAGNPGAVVLPPSPPATAEASPAAARVRPTAPAAARGTAPLAGGGWALPTGRPDTRAGSGPGGPGQQPREGTATGGSDELVAEAKRQQNWRWDLGQADPLDLLSEPRSGGGRAGAGGEPGDRMFQFDQFAVGGQEGNALLFGPYRLNTYAWNYAWWMQLFGQALRRNWMAPYAYGALGVISGLTEMRVVVERDGRLSTLEVRRREGHESLHFASEAAVKGAAPFTPLPADFPEPRLEIVLTLIYPDWAKLMREQQPPAGSREQTPAPRRGRR